LHMLPDRLGAAGRFVGSLFRLFSLWEFQLSGGFFVLAFAVAGSVVYLGYIVYLLRQYETEKAPGLDVLFSRFSTFWRAVGLQFLVLLKILLWSLLFVVPGIVAAYRYALSHFILAENPDMSVTAAIERSKELMYAHKARLFRLDLSFIGWILLSILTGGIGSVFLYPYMMAARTAFYLERTGKLPFSEMPIVLTEGNPPAESHETTQTEMI